MEWKVHYFDRRAGQDGVSRSHSTSEGALRNTCDLMRQNCRVDYITGPSNERINGAAIESWCKAHPNRRQPEAKRLRNLNAAAQTRIVSVVKIGLDSWKSMRPFKGIFCDDISEIAVGTLITERPPHRAERA